MTEIISLIIIVTVFSMMMFLTLRYYRYKVLMETKNRIAVILLAVTSGLLIMELFSGGDMCTRFSFNLMIVLVPFMYLASGTMNPKYVIRICMVSCALMALLYIPPLLKVSGITDTLPSYFYMSAFPFMAFLTVTVVVYGIWTRIKNVRTVMQSGTVLANLGLSIDMVYVLLILLLPLLSMLATSCAGIAGTIIRCFTALYAASILVALCIRLIYESFFAVCHDLERKIMESLKVSQMEMAGGVREGTYRELFERIVEYFESEKPFLDNQLTINDVVKVVFSNKVYISRSISQFTGRNFCQFVNYYRISYSVECFRADPDLKVNALAEMSGFNSVVSYNMAFRLFMNENPSDWCRKERHKNRKKKKI
jgi:AraC-like DNA-binding protein